jgi:hypothetical protein
MFALWTALAAATEHVRLGPPPPPDGPVVAPAPAHADLVPLLCERLSEPTPAPVPESGPLLVARGLFCFGAGMAGYGCMPEGYWRSFPEHARPPCGVAPAPTPEPAMR